jgi:hypothetical protein
MTPKSEIVKKDGRTKKPYERPRLEVYGDIGEVTDAVGTKSATADGALHGANKTA